MSSTVVSDTDLKQRHRTMWALGDYPRLAREVIPTLGDRLVRACRVTSGDVVLDVAAGAGNAALAAAALDADVVAADLTPELLDSGRRTAADAGLSLTWREADAEAMPFAEAEFDVVMSCVGVMFAPHHATAAAELLRVCRPGGRIGLLSWTPDGFIGQLFMAMKGFVPPPPSGVQAPPLWGSAEHVIALLGGGVSEIDARIESLSVGIFDSPADLRAYFKTHYGPTIAAYRAVGTDPAAEAELDAAIESVARRFWPATGTTMNWEYLLLTAVRT